MQDEQAGECARLTRGSRRVRFPSPVPCGESILEDGSVLQADDDGFDPRSPYHARVAQRQEAIALEAIQCGFNSLRGYQEETRATFGGGVGLCRLGLPPAHSGVAHLPT